MRNWAAVLVLVLALDVGCKGSEPPATGSAPAAAGSGATSRGSAVAASGSGGAAGSAAAAGSTAAGSAAAGSAARAANDAPLQPLTLLDEMRALPTTPGDRTKATAFHKQALKVHATHKYAESEKAWADAARADPSWTWPFYNLACTTAVQGRPLDALAYLEMMRDRDPDRQMLWRVEHDGELQSIRSRPEYEALVIEIEDGVREREANPPAARSGSAGGAAGAGSAGAGSAGAGSAGASSAGSGQERRPK